MQRYTKPLPGNEPTVQEWRRGAPGSNDPADRSNDSAEFPESWSGVVNRRTLMKIMGASLALTGASCAPPQEKIYPYVKMPEGLVPGLSVKFATAPALLGPGSPVVATTYEGRPTKLDGNPDHPWSAGKSDVFTQAAVLSLYDPDRSQSPRRNGEEQSWSAFESEFKYFLNNVVKSNGDGLRILSGAITSPTLAAQKAELAKQFPQAKWHRWEPVNAQNAYAGAQLAFGNPLQTIYRMDKAQVVLALDGDPLGPGPDQVRYSGDFAKSRLVRKGVKQVLRLYTAEPHMTLTGIQADRRLAIKSSRIAGVASALADHIAGNTPATHPDPQVQQFLQQAAADLTANRGKALVVVGESQPPDVHALVHWINDQLDAFGQTVEFAEPTESDPRDHAKSVASLAYDIDAGKVQMLLILGGNPAYDGPVDLGFSSLIPKVPFTIRLGVYEDETSRHCLWHLPESHSLESWADTKTPDGAASIVQPLITPLFDTRSVYEVVALVLGNSGSSGHDIVRNTWKSRQQKSFGKWWQQALSTGVASQGQTVDVRKRYKPPRPEVRTGGQESGFELSIRPDPSTWDGRFANNAWLQETPRPISKLVWGNALQVSEADARTLGVEDGDIVRLTADLRTIEAPVMVSSGQARGVLSMTLGGGRPMAGAVGTGVGANVYPLRTSKYLWTVPSVHPTKVGRRVTLATTQHYHSMDGRDIVRKYSLEQFSTLKNTMRKPPSLYPEYRYDTYSWAMTIDQNACTGCNACVVACQAENNVPVVGPEEVARGRDMHWLRIDSYVRGPQDNPEVLFQPVACMQCDKAPCESVCPTEASVHDGEGLNVQVYNRCIGTRFCQSNCPYKVRRFNFFGYADGQEYGNLGDKLYNAVSNPDVTVRARGVMEKCTYCVQRISRARRQAKKENRTIAEGEVVTACQQACPTNAIHFGDLNSENGIVSKLRRQPHAYYLLEDLGTRPRTSYLAVVRADMQDGKTKA